MTDKEKADKIRAEIEAAIQASCADLLGKPNSRELMEEHIKRTLDATVLRGRESNKPALDYSTHCHEEGKLTLRPNNLFTGLIMSGIPYADAKPYLDASRAEAKFPQGTYRYSDEGGFTFQPNQPAEFITIKFSLNGDGEVIE